jgi:hypothetical protein
MIKDHWRKRYPRQIDRTEKFLIRIMYLPPTHLSAERRLLGFHSAKPETTLSYLVQKEEEIYLFHSSSKLLNRLLSFAELGMQAQTQCSCFPLHNRPSKSPPYYLCDHYTILNHKGTKFSRQKLKKYSNHKKAPEIQSGLRGLNLLLD